MQTIYLDIANKGVIPCIQAKQSEIGRKFLAVITDNGVPYNIPNDSLLSVWYEGDTDAGNYSSIEEKSAFDIDGNKVAVELVAQMLLNPGNGELCLSITHGDGGETNTWNIPYCVEYKPGAGSAVPTEYYTALTDASARAAEQVSLAKKEAESAREYAQEAEEATEWVHSLFVESDQHPGCYYRMVDGQQEWVNPPMVPGVEYRTTERHNGKVKYKKLVLFGEFPQNSAAEVSTNIDSSKYSIISAQRTAKETGTQNVILYVESITHEYIGVYNGGTYNIAVRTNGQQSITAEYLIEYVEI